MKKAFSLIELSIVILIIGIIIAGITQSSKLLNKAALISAQTLTKNSPVSGIEDLATWYETSLMSNSYQDGDRVANWEDINPQASNKNNTYSLGPPTFTTNIINGLPVIRFGADESFIAFDGKTLNSDSSTLFAVGKTIINNGNGGALAITDGGIYGLCFTSDTYSIQRFINGAATAASYEPNSTATPTIHTITSSSSDGLKYWNNGGVTPDAVDPTTGAIIYSPSANAQAYGDLDLAELIIFSRVLKNKERQAVESYLSKKYGIAITN
jgi:prepilin-type N-terminal cleavage/methylation domain-containing protein